MSNVTSAAVAPGQTPEPPVVSVIMPCYNRSHDLARVLQAYQVQKGETPFELIAVDDASGDDTFHILSTYPAQRFSLHAVRQERNMGPAAARNRGLALAQGELVAFVGDDILPDPDFVQQIVDAHRRHPDPETAILGHIRWAEDLPCNTLMAHIDGRGAQQFSYFYLRDGQEYDYRHFYTANISLKRSLLSRTSHWFDTQFPYAAFEDAELAYRLARQGMRIRYCAEVRVQHYHYHTIWSFSRRQFLSGRAAWRLLRLHPATARDILPRGHHWLGAALRLRVGHLSADTADHLEYLACVLASFYEWHPHPLVDDLYLHLLAYFYYAGLVIGLSSSTVWQRLARTNLAWARLLPILNRHIRKSQAVGLPVPPGFHPHLKRALASRGRSVASGRRKTLLKIQAEQARPVS